MLLGGVGRSLAAGLLARRDLRDRALVQLQHRGQILVCSSALSLGADNASPDGGHQWPDRLQISEQFADCNSLIVQVVQAVEPLDGGYEFVAHLLIVGDPTPVSGGSTCQYLGDPLR